MKTMYHFSMEGKRGLIIGVANEKSIAWAIAKSVHHAGAQLALTYQNTLLERRVRPLAKEIGSDIVIPCDVEDPLHMESLFKTLKETWGHIDFIVHSLAWSDKEALRGRYIETTRENFTRTLAISCFSLTEIVRHALPLMKDRGGSIVTMSYYGAEKAIPNYNVMGVAKAALEASVRYLAMDVGHYGIRVNALSAGPIKTLAASGIGDFNAIRQWAERNAPLRRTVTQEDIAASGHYLLSDLSRGVSGEVHHVDCGYHIVGMEYTHHAHTS